MKKIFLLALSCITLFSCKVPSYYLPALSGSDITYLPKPMTSDSLKSKNYVSGSYAALSLPFNSGNVHLGFLNFSRANTFKKLNIAYGAFGAIGQAKYDNQFKNSDQPIYSYRGLFAGGLRTSIGIQLHSGRTDFRVLSWESALSFESGSYANLRQELINKNDPYIISSAKKTLFTTGGATEIIFHTKENTGDQIGFKLFAGYTSGLNDSYITHSTYGASDLSAVDLSVFFKTGSVFGIFGMGANRGAAGKLSVGYAF